jgi:hypothetical protein
MSPRSIHVETLKECPSRANPNNKNRSQQPNLFYIEFIHLNWNQYNFLPWLHLSSLCFCLLENFLQISAILFWKKLMINSFEKKTPFQTFRKRKQSSFSFFTIFFQFQMIVQVLIYKKTVKILISVCNYLYCFQCEIIFCIFFFLHVITHRLGLYPQILHH